MRALLVIIYLLLASSATNARTLAVVGDRACAEAGVVAGVLNTNYENIAEGGIVLRAHVVVKKILFGPLSEGPLRVVAMNEELNPEIHTWRIYLERERVGQHDWTFAKCR
jgi:hypothetical protein